jgi:hypothetical protein
MKNFKFCYPDADRFNKVIKLKTLNDWKTEYVELDREIGYWTAEHPFVDDSMFEIFKNLIASFPVQKDNNHPDNFDPNPFDTIHVPEWISQDICFLLKEFYLKNISTNIYDPQIHEWGNLYFKERSQPIKCWRIPHIDYEHGIVANLWFTSHPLTESGTRLYRYHGTLPNGIYDFQVDQKHPMFNEWRELAEGSTIRSPAWFNMPESDLARWGFEYVGSAPNNAGSITMYKANVCHTPHLTEAVDFRWSHAFAFSHILPPARTLGELF